MQRNRWFGRAAAAAALALGAPLVLTAPAAQAQPAELGSTQTAAAPAAVTAAAARSVSVTASSSAADIKGLQLLLNADGASLDVDGKYGPKTDEAVIAFQKAKGLEADGKVGPKTIEKLGVTVKEGTGNANAVKAVQELLVKNGHGIAVDGKFGPATAGAVKDLQGKAGVDKDGVVGPVTWTYLFGPKVGGGNPPSDCSQVTESVPQSETVIAGNNMRVHKCAEKAVNDMVAAAASDGITLSANSSWRSIESQIELRKQNCGPTEYDIWQKPASQCSPPTAIPGTSRHERGLAIDFANSSTHGTAVFQWLDANAATYGFYNLPSEPWHWSTDGH